MVNYSCDSCGKPCDAKYINLKITPDLKHDPQKDIVYVSSKTEENTSTKLLCPDCLETIKTFIRERLLSKARTNLYG